MTAIDWLVEKVNSDCLNSTFIRKELIDEAKEREKQQIIDACGLALSKLLYDQALKSQISDEEIEKGAMETMDYVYLNPNDSLIFHQGWMRAIKWYREQLKKL